MSKYFRRRGFVFLDRLLLKACVRIAGGFLQVVGSPRYFLTA